MQISEALRGVYIYFLHIVSGANDPISLVLTEYQALPHVLLRTRALVPSFQNYTLIPSQKVRPSSKFKLPSVQLAFH